MRPAKEIDPMFFKGSRDSILITLSAKCPTATGGIYNIQFKGRYRCPLNDEARQLIEDAGSSLKTDDDVVRALMTDWEGVSDTDGEPIKFSDEALADALNYPPYRAAIVNGAMEVLFTREVLREKNSQARASRG
jgi:hypothetical protein